MPIPGRLGLLIKGVQRLTGPQTIVNPKVGTIMIDGDGVRRCYADVIGIKNFNGDRERLSGNDRRRLR